MNEQNRLEKLYFSKMFKNKKNYIHFKYRHNIQYSIRLKSALTIFIYCFLIKNVYTTFM